MQQGGSVSHGPQLGDVTAPSPRMAEFADLMDARFAEPGVAHPGRGFHPPSLHKEVGG